MPTKSSSDVALVEFNGGICPNCINLIERGRECGRKEGRIDERKGKKKGCERG